jgi:hypothetical protein
MDGLELDLETHRYTYDGQPVGGVSEILQSLGIVESQWFNDYAMSRGTAVHSAIEYMLRGKLDWRSVDERIKGYVEAAVSFMDAAGIPASPLKLIERPVYHATWRYAGMPDLIAVAFGELSTVDWKSGGLGHAGMALAAYESAYRVSNGLTRPLRRMAVQLKPDGSFKKTDYVDPHDYIDWQACCLIYNRYLINRRR